MNLTCTTNSKTCRRHNGTIYLPVAKEYTRRKQMNLLHEHYDISSVGNIRWMAHGLLYFCCESDIVKPEILESRTSGLPFSIKRTSGRTPPIHWTLTLQHGILSNKTYLSHKQVKPLKASDNTVYSSHKLTNKVTCRYVAGVTARAS